MLQPAVATVHGWLVTGGRRTNRMLATALLLGLMLIAALTDLIQHKIYNWTTYPGMILGLAVNAWQSGWPGLEAGVKGFALCGFIMLVCFVLLEIGGGDVKLMAMLGAFLGMERGMEAMLWTFVIGAILGIAALIWRVGFLCLLKNAVKQLSWSLRLARWQPLTEEERKQLQPPLYLAPSAACAVVIVEFDLLKYL